MGRFPRVMPANAGIQDTTTLTEFRLLATPAQAQALRRRVASRWIPAFAGMTKRAFPNAVLTASCWRSEAIHGSAAA